MVGSLYLLSNVYLVRQLDTMLYVDTILTTKHLDLKVESFAGFVESYSLKCHKHVTPT
jgi:hypothetical protein